MVENREFIYIYRQHFRSVYVYTDGSDKICRESLHSIYESLNNKSFVKIKKYIISIEHIKKVRIKEITLSDGAVLYLSKKDNYTVRLAIHNYNHHVLEK